MLRKAENEIQELTTSKFKILFNLKKLGGKARSTQLIAATELTTSVFYPNLKDLESKGFVTRTDSKIVLTEKGEQALKGLKRILEVVA